VEPARRKIRGRPKKRCIEDLVADKVVSPVKIRRRKDKLQI
jgi:hypothetical protein